MQVRIKVQDLRRTLMTVEDTFFFFFVTNRGQESLGLLQEIFSLHQLIKH